MEVNGITSATNILTSYPKRNVENIKNETKNVLADMDVKDGAIYEKTTDKISSKVDPELVAKLKEENNARIKQLEELVNKTISGQANTFNIANGSNLKDFFTNLQLTKEQIEKAKEDISEDGYWGVKQTSQRIFDFAKALSGGENEGMQKMFEAFKKGYDQATKQWGDELPEISKKTFNAVQKLFEDYNENKETE